MLNKIIYLVFFCVFLSSIALYSSTSYTVNGDASAATAFSSKNLSSNFGVEAILVGGDHIWNFELNYRTNSDTLRDSYIASIVNPSLSTLSFNLNYLYSLGNNDWTPKLKLGAGFAGGNSLYWGYPSSFDESVKNNLYNVNVLKVDLGFEQQFGNPMNPVAKTYFNISLKQFSLPHNKNAVDADNLKLLATGISDDFIYSFDVGGRFTYNNIRLFGNISYAPKMELNKVSALIGLQIFTNLHKDVF